MVPMPPAVATIFGAKAQGDATKSAAKSVLEAEKAKAKAAAQAQAAQVQADRDAARARSASTAAALDFGSRALPYILGAVGLAALPAVLGAVAGRRRTPSRRRKVA
jgi:hypothetical protein